MHIDSGSERVPLLRLDEASARELESRRFDHEAGASAGRWSLLAIVRRWCKEFRNFYTIPPARGCIQKQLESRQDFFEAEWRKTGLPLDAVRTTLDCIRSSHDWPNFNILPEDSVDLLLICSSSSMADVELTVELEDRLSIRLTDEHLERLNQRGRTVEGFVRELLRMTPDAAAGGSKLL